MKGIKLALLILFFIALGIITGLLLVSQVEELYTHFAGADLSYDDALTVDFITVLGFAVFGCGVGVSLALYTQEYPHR